MGRRGRRKDGFWDSALMNNASYYQYFERLVELSISMFEWKNLPDTVDERFIELKLFTQGKILYFNDEAIGNICLPFAYGGRLNMYQIPTVRRAYSNTGYSNTLDESNSVIIFNNMLHTPSEKTCHMFAQRLYNLDRIVDVNANAQKTPILIRCAENERQTYLNLYKEYDGNAPMIGADRNLDPKGLQVLNTNAPYVADKIYDLKCAIWNEALTYLGINNINVSKKERMITDEVMRNSGGIIASRYSRLTERQRACEKINKMFGTNISCEYREDFAMIDDGIEDTTKVVE